VEGKYKKRGGTAAAKGKKLNFIGKTQRRGGQKRENVYVRTRNQKEMFGEKNLQCLVLGDSRDHVRLAKIRSLSLPGGESNDGL